MSVQEGELGLDVLHTAVFADRGLVIRYRHSDDPTVRTYTVDPYGLVFKAGTWYLVADRDGEPRLFRAERILGARITDEPARRRPGVELTEVWEGLRRGVEERTANVKVRARIRTERLNWFIRVSGSRTRRCARYGNSSRTPTPSRCSTLPKPAPNSPPRHVR